MLLRLELAKVFICFEALIAGAIESSWSYGFVGAVLLYIALHVSWCLAKQGKDKKYFFGRFLIASTIHFITFVFYSLSLYRGQYNPDAAGHIYIVAMPVIIIILSLAVVGMKILLEKLIGFIRHA